MIKIWFMLVLISMPNAPSVKYNGFIYSYCVEFEGFPIAGLNKTGA
jgi:hypothetical protein